MPCSCDLAPMMAGTTLCVCETCKPRNSLALLGSWKHLPSSFPPKSQHSTCLPIAPHAAALLQFPEVVPRFRHRYAIHCGHAVPSTYSRSVPNRVRHRSMSPRQTARQSSVQPKLRFNDERSPIQLIPFDVSVVKHILESTQLLFPFRNAR
jgi:hypothetical protein